MAYTMAGVSISMTMSMDRAEHRAFNAVEDIPEELLPLAEERSGSGAGRYRVPIWAWELCQKTSPDLGYYSYKSKTMPERNEARRRLLAAAADPDAAGAEEAIWRMRPKEDAIPMIATGPARFSWAGQGLQAGPTGLPYSLVTGHATVPDPAGANGPAAPEEPTWQPLKLPDPPPEE